MTEETMIRVMFGIGLWMVIMGSALIMALHHEIYQFIRKVL